MYIHLAKKNIHELNKDFKLNCPEAMTRNIQGWYKLWDKENIFSENVRKIQSSRTDINMLGDPLFHFPL